MAESARDAVRSAAPGAPSWAVFRYEGGIQPIASGMGDAPAAAFYLRDDWTQFVMLRVFLEEEKGSLKASFALPLLCCPSCTHLSCMNARETHALCCPVVLAQKR